MPLCLIQFNAAHTQDVGIFGTTFFFDVLLAHGQEQLGIEVLKETSYPSLGYMIEAHATTLWESWEGSQHVQVGHVQCASAPVMLVVA